MAPKISGAKKAAPLKTVKKPRKAATRKSNKKFGKRNQSLHPQEVDSSKILAARKLAAIKGLALREEIRLKQRIEVPSTFESVKHDDFKTFSKPSRYPKGLKFPSGSIGQNSLIQTAKLYVCPKIGPEVLPKAEMKAKIREYLMNLPKDDVKNTYLLIHSLNEPEQVSVCAETLRKILWNIMWHPRIPMYRKIRFANKAFQKRVAGVEGASEFMAAVGFTKQLVKMENSHFMEKCWIFSTDEDVDDYIERLSNIWHDLREAEPVKATVYRNIKILSVDQVDPKLEPILPPDFFDSSSLQFCTGEVNNREGHVAIRFCLIRIKFPDGHILQGTFSCKEKVGDIYTFVRESLSLERETTSFLLKKYEGSYLDEVDATLLECGLAPASILIFKGLSVSAKLAIGRNSYIRTKILKSALALS